jgi:hypothetical protein
MKPFRFIIVSFVALAGMVFLGTGLAQAANITGTISTTQTIVTNSH